MGWGSAGQIFDAITDALIDAGAAEQVKRDVLFKTAKSLFDGDWDTEDESFERFCGELAAVQAFYLNGRCDSLGDYGRMTYEKEPNQWSVWCERPGRCGELARGDGDSWTEHNQLIELWAEHDRSRHGGSGEIPEWRLMTEPDAPAQAAITPDQAYTDGWRACAAKIYDHLLRYRDGQRTVMRAQDIDPSAAHRVCLKLESAAYIARQIGDGQTPIESAPEVTVSCPICGAAAGDRCAGLDGFHRERTLAMVTARVATIAARYDVDPELARTIAAELLAREAGPR